MLMNNKRIIGYRLVNFPVVERNAGIVSGGFGHFYSYHCIVVLIQCDMDTAQKCFHLPIARNQFHQVVALARKIFHFVFRVIQNCALHQLNHQAVDLPEKLVRLHIIFADVFAILYDHTLAIQNNEVFKRVNIFPSQLVGSFKKKSAGGDYFFVQYAQTFFLSEIALYVECAFGNLVELLFEGGSVIEQAEAIGLGMEEVSEK